MKKVCIKADNNKLEKEGETNDKMEEQFEMVSLEEQSKLLSPLAAQKDDNIDSVEPSKLYSFKLQLQRPNPAFADEYFCTTVNENTANDFESMNQELLRVIPKIKNRTFDLKLVDPEGNGRTISDNEDLGAALKEMEGPAYK